MDFWFCVGFSVVGNKDGKSSMWFDFNASNQTWLTGDGGDTGTMTSPGIELSPLGNVGQVFNFHDGAANQAQYQVTGTATDVVSFELYNGVAIPNGIVIDQETGPFVGLGPVIDVYTQGDWIWCRSIYDYTTEHGVTDCLGEWNPGHQSSVVITTFCHYKDIPGDAADHPDIMGVDSDYAINLDAADEGLNDGLSYNGFGATFNIRFIGFSVFGAIQNGWNLNLMRGCQYINCDAHANGSIGAYFARNSVVSGFQSSGNGTIGMYAGTNSIISDLKAFGNVQIGFSALSFYGILSNALIYGNAGGALLYGGWVADGCTIDGGTLSPLYALGTRPRLIKNSIIVNGSPFELCGAAGREDYRYMFQNCLLGMYTGDIMSNNELAIFRNTTDLGALATYGDFGFVNAVGNDYRLKKRSIAVEAGLPAYRSIGYHEPERQKFTNVGQVVD